jgi:hypothetical protein
MAAVNQNFELWAGEDKLVTFTVYDVNNALVNLTGVTQIKWALSDKTNTRVLQALLSGGDGDVVVLAQSGGTLGQFTVQIEGADTTGLAPGQYLHQAFVTDASGNSEVVTEGQVTLKRNINL